MIQATKILQIAKEFIMDSQIANYDQEIERMYHPENFERTVELEPLGAFDVQEYPRLNIGDGLFLFATGTNLRKDLPM